MLVQVALPKLRAPVTLAYEDRLSDRAYFAFCEANPDLRLERTAEGEIVIVPPAGYESDYRSNRASAQLDRWAMRDGRGKASGSSVQLFLPDGSALSPDAAWVSNEALKRRSREELKKFPYLCPEFVIEVMSPSDRLKKAQAKMEQWIANGVQLAWLIDGDAETVYVYQKDRPVEKKQGVLKLAGKGPVKGLTLQLRAIWDGLR
jgi:Uma2 family endonuclease